MASVQAIIFDVDGTLAETEEVHRASFNRAFAEAGLDWHWDEALYGRLLRVAGGKERIAHFAPDLDAGTIARLHARKTELYVGGITGAALRPGIADLIGEARAAGMRLAIATTTTRANVEALLNANFEPRAPSFPSEVEGRTFPDMARPSTSLGKDGAGDVFEVIVAGDEVPLKKPAPDVYLAVLDRLGLPAGECVAIEDSADGLASARAAGIMTVVMPSRYMAGGEFSGAALIALDRAPTLAAIRDAHHVANR